MISSRKRKPTLRALKINIKNIIITVTKLVISQQTQICTAFVQRRPNIFDLGPTLELRHKQGWGQIRICICICVFVFEFSVFVFVFDFLKRPVFVFVFVFDPCI